MKDNREFEWLVSKQKAAEQFERDGRYGDAIEAYLEVVTRDPSWGNGWCFLALAEIHEKLDQMEKAESFFEKSVDQNNDPPSPTYRSNYAAFLLERGKSDKAFEYFLKALKVAVDLQLTEMIPAIISGIRTSAERIPLPTEQVEGKIAGIVGDVKGW